MQLSSEQRKVLEESKKFIIANLTPDEKRIFFSYLKKAFKWSFEKFMVEGEKLVSYKDDKPQIDILSLHKSALAGRAGKVYRQRNADQKYVDFIHVLFKIRYIVTAYRRQQKDYKGALAYVDFCMSSLKELQFRYQTGFPSWLNHSMSLLEQEKEKINSEAKSLPVKTYIKWGGTGNLSTFSRLLYEYKVTERPTSFRQMIQEHEKIVWKKGTAELAYFLHKMIAEKYLLLSGGKGHFSVAADYFKDYTGKDANGRKLKDLSYKISKNPLKYTAVVSLVNELISQIK